MENVTRASTLAEEDEQDSKEAVLQRYFLQEWQQVKSILHSILSNGRVTDLSSVRKIRSIVSLSFISLYFEFISVMFVFCWLGNVLLCLQDLIVGQVFDKLLEWEIKLRDPSVPNLIQKREFKI